MTREELIAALEPDEVDYERIVRLIGSEASAYLPELIAGERVDIAAKAASLAGLLESDDRLRTLEMAARSPHGVVRVAAAAAAVGVSTSEAEQLVPIMLDDADPSVRKLAIRAAAPVTQRAPVRAALARIREYDAVDALRQSAGDLAGSEETSMPSDDEIIERTIARFGPVIDLRTNPQDFIDVVRAATVDLSPDGGLPPGGTPSPPPPPPGPTSLQASEATLDDVMAEVLNLSRRLAQATGEIAELRGRLER
ncbi:hypothetical protein ACT8ZV_13995 [Nocardioides sp. MAHUQ-72]|uniref:hypothetical protein n=1 Tax=unclassified Nocardioides TaxID=2615069 RepID=UPI00360CE7C2